MVWNKLLICSLLVFWETDRNNAQSLRNSQAEVRSETDAVNYLSGRNWIPAGRASAAVDLNDLLRNFQMYTGLPVTGILDEATKAKMNSPQCGNPDFDEVGFTLNVTRKKRYTHLESRWPHEITWYLENGTPDLNINIVRSEMIRAFQRWADVTPLTFREVFSTNADIIVKFAVRDHGDDNSFDGPGWVLAHAFQPGHGRGGDIHFDDDEQFTTGTGINLLQVAVHEIGHSLGMGHSNDINAIMAPYYTYRANFALGSDDINGIQALYGENCHATCQEVPAEEGRTIDYTDNTENQKQHNSHLTVTCGSHMVRLGQITSTCVSGAWSPPVAHCKENLALGKDTNQVSTDFGGDARRAVDGITSGRYLSESCTHTSRGSNTQWWYVDLGSSVLVQEIVIYNRQDNHHSRLLHAKVRVGDITSDVTLNSWAGTVHNTEINPIHLKLTPPIEGRIVSVSELNPGNPLTLCEVQVFGEIRGCVNGCEVPHLQNGYFTTIHGRTRLQPLGCVSLGSNILVHCEEGLILEGSYYYQCQQSGRWYKPRGVDATCQVCPSGHCVVPYIENGHYFTSSGRAPLVNGSCTSRIYLYVTCDDGMQREGSYFYLCREGKLITRNDGNVFTLCT